MITATVYLCPFYVTTPTCPPLPRHIRASPKAVAHIAFSSGNPVDPDGIAVRSTFARYG